MNPLLLFCLLLGASTIVSGDLLSFKIIGGKTMSIEDHPYQAALEIRHFHFCGGAIVSKKFIVTASHCFPTIVGSGRIPELGVRVGAEDLLVNNGELINVAKITKHPQAEFVRYDIAIVELETPLKYSNKVQPIRLPGEGDVLEPGNMAYVTGYGITLKPDYQKTLEMIQVPIMPRDECDLYYPNLVKEYMFCAGYKYGGMDSCQGDSGGPLAYNGILYGVVSWGDECAQPESPGVYTNVSYFMPFVKEITGL